MINNEFPITKKEAQAFEPLPEDIFPCELLDVEVEQKPNYNDKNIIENVLKFQFTLLSGFKAGESLRGRNIWLNFVPIYFYISKKSGKNKLYQIVEALLKRELTQEEEATFSASKLNKLIGMQCRILVKNKPSSDGQSVFSNVDRLLPAVENLTPLTQEEKEKAKIKKTDTKTPADHLPQADQYYEETGRIQDDYEIPANPDKMFDLDVKNIPF